MNEYPGFKVDTDAIAAGLLRIIKEHPDGACMTLGMFPKEIMDALEDGLKERIPDRYVWENAKTREGGVENGKELRDELTHEICCKVLALASEEGFCIV